MVNRTMLFATFMAASWLATSSLAATPTAFVTGAGTAPAAPLAGRSARTRSPLAALCPKRIDSRVAASTPRLLVFGELHGTQQAPAFIFQLACDHVLRTPEQPLLIALELRNDQHKALQTLLAHPDADHALTQFLAQPFWAHPAQDGRTSIAQLDLVRGIARLRQQGANIDLLPFDISESKPAQMRDAQMAKRILAALRATPEARMFVLTGNWHAARSTGDDADKRMVDFLDHPYRSYLFVSPRMKAWTCNGPLPADCHDRSPATFKSQNDYPATRALSEARIGEPGYDALINLGPTDASPPAVSLIKK